MGYQILQQPSGKLAIFSSFTDTVIVWDATRQEIIEYFVDLAIERTRRDVEGLLGHVTAGEPRKAYYQFAMTWEEAMSRDREHGGEAWAAFPSSSRADT